MSSLRLILDFLKHFVTATEVAESHQNRIRVANTSCTMPPKVMKKKKLGKAKARKKPLKKDMSAARTKVLRDLDKKKTEKTKGNIRVLFMVHCPHAPAPTRCVFNSSSVLGKELHADQGEPGRSH